MSRKPFAIILLLLFIVASGCSTTTFNVTEETVLTGDVTFDDLVDAYDKAWNEACDDVFLYHDSLYYGNMEYNYYDFYNYSEDMPDYVEEYPDTEYPYTSNDLDDAEYMGRETALDTIFSDTDVLCYGEERFYRYDF